ALPLLSGEPAGGGRGGSLAALSEEALRYAQALPGAEPLRLSASLYGYNRRPLTPRWRRLLPDAAAVPRFLGIAPGGPWAAAVARRWQARPPAPGWISWRARGGRGAGLPRLPEAGPIYKLYMSPAPEALAADGGAGCFGAIAAALAAARAPQWKAGADLAGL